MPTVNMLDRVREIVSMMFNTPEAEISADTSMENLDAWDSMGHLMLILEIEQQFECQFAPEQVEKMTSVSAIVETLEAL